MKVIAITVFTTFTLILSLAVDAGNVEVIKNRVNLRAGDNSNKEVVGQVNAGDVMEYFSEKGDWIEVRPPDSVSAYVHREFIKDGLVQATPLNLRAGASLNYSRIGQVEQGYAIEVRGEKGDWIEIAPPDTTRVWIHKSLIKKVDESTAIEHEASSTSVGQPDQPEVAAEVPSQPLQPELPEEQS